MNEPVMCSSLTLEREGRQRPNIINQALYPSLVAEGHSVICTVCAVVLCFVETIGRDGTTVSGLIQRDS